MPQIAQQDYIVIKVVDISSPTNDEKAALQKVVDNGTLFDCIIASEFDENGNPNILARPLYLEKDAKEIVFMDSTSVTTIVYGV